MKLVYIAGPLTHPNPTVMNRRRSRALAVGALVEASGDFVAFVPHAHILEPRSLNPETVWREAMAKCITVLRRCDYILPMPDWEQSRGARVELWLCRRRSGFPVVIPNLETLFMEALDGEHIA